MPNSVHSLPSWLISTSLCPWIHPHSTWLRMFQWFVASFFMSALGALWSILKYCTSTLFLIGIIDIWWKWGREKGREEGTEPRVAEEHFQEGLCLGLSKGCGVDESLRMGNPPNIACHSLPAKSSSKHAELYFPTWTPVTQTQWHAPQGYFP